MQKSYVAKTTINFVDFEFYIRPGDLLVHDTANHNRLTVYRNGQIVKVVKQGPLGIVAFLKSKFIEEVTSPPEAEAPKVVEPEVQKSKKLSKEEELALKRRKAHGVEIVGTENYPPRLREALGMPPVEEPKSEETPETPVEK